MMNDPNFTEVMAYISSSFSPLVNINRRVVNLESPQTRHGLFSFDDVGNVDYTGIEPKYTLNQSEFIWDSDLSKSNRFPHFPARQPASSRRQEGKEEEIKKYDETQIINRRPYKVRKRKFILLETVTIQFLNQKIPLERITKIIVLKLIEYFYGILFSRN